MLLKGCGTGAESPERSEDLERMARTEADEGKAADSPKHQSAFCIEQDLFF
jgi:hypothetical protein